MCKLKEFASVREVGLKFLLSGLSKSKGTQGEHQNLYLESGSLQRA